MCNTHRKVLVIAGIIFCLFSSVFAYSGGSGAAANPYQIADTNDLLALGSAPTDYNKCFILTADINMAGQVFTTAIIAADTNSSSGFQGTSFNGIFDGNGYKIINFTINGGSNYYLGLFGKIDSGGSVKNLGLENVNVIGRGYLGGLVGYNDYYSSISNCYSTGTVSGSSGITSLSYYFGGLVGFNIGSISNCYSTGGVSSYGYYVGGLVGANYSGGSISNCYSTGAVSGSRGSRYVGGLVGGNGGSITDCYATGTVTGSATNVGEYGVGGLVGNNASSISNCYSTGVVSGSHHVGGLVGHNDYYSSISNCYSTGTVSGSSDWVGGLVGFNNYNSSISNCYATGVVTGKYRVGGLVGVNYNSSISNCYSTGAVTGKYDVGGLVGDNYNSSISNCYSTGDVSGLFDYVGGLVGWNYSEGSIINCYSTGAVNGGSGSSYVGGLVGRNSGNVSASFWDVNTSGRTTSAGGTGKTTAEMKTRSTFTSAGWDFVGETTNGTADIWTICQDVNYPKFTWQNQPPIAEAGPDQTVYAWIDGIAEVDLDGFGSSDPDCNELTYYWSWVIDGNTDEAGGANPTIELPVGVHTIELIVNDGLLDSQPDYVDVNVVAPLKADLSIVPSVVNRSNHLRNIIAVMELPKGIKKTDVSKEPFVLFPADSEEGIESVRQYILPWCRHSIRVFALFDKDELMDIIPDSGKVELQVVGQLKSGRYVFGDDAIRIIGRHPFWWRWRWHK